MPLAGSCQPLPSPNSSPSLMHPDPCYSPLGLAQLPEGSLHALPQQLERPTWAAILRPPTEAPGQQGWSPVEEAYTQWHAQPPYLQLDLLWPWNLTGAWGGGKGWGRRWQTVDGGSGGVGGWWAGVVFTLTPVPPPRHRAHLTDGETEAQLGEVIYDGTRAWSGGVLRSPSSCLFVFPECNSLPGVHLLSAQKPRSIQHSKLIPGSASRGRANPVPSVFFSIFRSFFFPFS